MRKNRIALAATAVILTGASLLAAGCSNQLNDIKGVGQVHPDYIITYLNVDAFPNVTMLCIKGVGFATTTRDNNAAITRIPEWDKFCASKATGN